MDAADALRILDEERERGARVFEEASTLDELEAAQVSVLGRKARFSEVQRSLGALPEDERRAVGKAVNEARAALEAALASRREVLHTTASARLLDADRIDLSLPGRALRHGSLHPFTIIQYEIVDIFTHMGYTV